MTAHAGDAIARVAFGPVARCPTAVLCPENCDSDRSLEGLLFSSEKNRSIGHCMAAMGIRPGTEDAVQFHLRITCANLASCGDDFIHK
jgi:hypothetical protein